MPALLFDTVTLLDDGLRREDDVECSFRELGLDGDETLRLHARELVLRGAPDRSIDLAADRLIVTHPDAILVVPDDPERHVRVVAQHIEGRLRIAGTPPQEPGGGGAGSVTVWYSTASHPPSVDRSDAGAGVEVRRLSDPHELWTRWVGVQPSCREQRQRRWRRAHLMRAVWSFWSTPFVAHRAGMWGTERNHRLAWILSFECARQHYPRTALVTDDDGARLLVDELGLEFDTVSLALNGLAGHDPSWWTAGKLVAIGEQDEPFVHLDPDVFLWSALPAALTGAPVFAQNPEPYSSGGTYYRPELLEAVLASGDDTWVPEEWGWYGDPGVIPRGECCGVVGGTHTDFLRHYAHQGLRLIREPGNRPHLARLPDRQDLTITLEQYLLAACIERHRQRPESPYDDVHIEYLFQSWAEAANAERATQLGFTHLIAHTKRDPEIAARLERRVEQDYPDRYERCARGISVLGS